MAELIVNCAGRYADLNVEGETVRGHTNDLSRLVCDSELTVPKKFKRYLRDSVLREKLISINKSLNDLLAHTMHYEDCEDLKYIRSRVDSIIDRRGKESVPVDLRLKNGVQHDQTDNEKILARMSRINTNVNALKENVKTTMSNVFEKNISEVVKKFTLKINDAEKKFDAVLKKCTVLEQNMINNAAKFPLSKTLKRRQDDFVEQQLKVPENNLVIKTSVVENANASFDIAVDFSNKFGSNINIQDSVYTNSEILDAEKIELATVPSALGSFKTYNNNALVEMKRVFEKYNNNYVAHAKKMPAAVRANEARRLLGLLHAINQGTRTISGSNFSGVYTKIEYDFMKKTFGLLNINKHYDVFHYECAEFIQLLHKCVKFYK